MVWGRSLAALAALALAALLSSCASSERMMRLSPTAGKDHQDRVKFDNQTVNIWPFFYRNDKFTSAVWPMIDRDDRGFAVRPFFNQEDAEYSILFPFSAWNPQKGDGWAFNTYWTPQRVGSFPLFHCGPRDDLNYVMPVWWTRGRENVLYTGIPGTCFSRRLNFVGPLWLNHDQHFSGGLFPLFWQFHNSGHFFPLYYYDTNNGIDAKLFFGALGQYSHSTAANQYHYRFVNVFHVRKNQNVYSGFIPLYYYQNDGRDSAFLTPVVDCHWNASGTASSYNVMFGLMGRFASDQNPENPSTHNRFANVFHVTGKDAVYSGAIPLYYYQREGKDSTLLAPVTDHHWNAVTGAASHNVMAGVLGRFASDPNPAAPSTHNRFANVFHVTRKDDVYSGAFPLYYYQREGKDSMVISPLGGYGWDNVTGQARFQDWMGPLYYQSQSAESQFRSVMFPFYIQQITPKDTTVSGLPLFWYSQDPKQQIFSAMGPLYYRKTTATTEKIISFPLLWYDALPNDRLLSILGPFYLQMETPQKTTVASLPLFWTSRNPTSPDGRFYSVLGPLYMQKTTPGQTFVASLPLFWYDRQKPQTVFSALGPLYIQKTAPERTFVTSLPLFWYDRDHGHTTFGAVPPLYLYRSARPQHDVLWPLVSWRGGARTEWYGWPLIEYHTDIPALLMLEERVTAFLGPFGCRYEHSGDDFSLWSMLFFYHGRQTESALRCQPLSGFRRWTGPRQETRTFAVWFYENHGEYRTLKPAFAGSDYNLLQRHLELLVSALSRPVPKSAAQVPPSPPKTKETLPQPPPPSADPSVPARKAAKLAPKLSDADRARQQIAHFMTRLKLHEPMPATAAECRELTQKLHDSCTEPMPYRRCLMPLFFDYQALGGDYRWNVFFVLARGQRTDRDAIASVLWYFYRREQSGDNVSTSVFPFINWKSAPDRFRISFLWRVYAYERNHDKIGGHIFFIPF